VFPRLNSGRFVDWKPLAQLIEIPHDHSYPRPENEHGTHVAGILAADWRPEDGTGAPDEGLIGICPDLELYDLRVFNARGSGDEFSILAALQFVRWLNASKDKMQVQGVNLSFSLRHMVDSFACGATPVCEECARLVASGVVVVAAAGNRGYDDPGDGGFGAYRPSSLADPGNAEDVITVGATHRYMPHKYGVSYFSSRGPTGDGRMKPDLVAPGEKIVSTTPKARWVKLDGTSMAAPHVSGAAALLLARHRELIGSPLRVKKILCSTATDLGRTREFQGAGMLDVLRALQSV
jgi:subtilisin family serine protease